MKGWLPDLAAVTVSTYLMERKGKRGEKGCAATNPIGHLLTGRQHRSTDSRNSDTSPPAPAVEPPNSVLDVQDTASPSNPHGCALKEKFLPIPIQTSASLTTSGGPGHQKQAALGQTRKDTSCSVPPHSSSPQRSLCTLVVHHLLALRTSPWRSTTHTRAISQGLQNLQV